MPLFYFDLPEIVDLVEKSTLEVDVVLYHPAKSVGAVVQVASVLVVNCLDGPSVACVVVAVVRVGDQVVISVRSMVFARATGQK